MTLYDNTECSNTLCPICQEGTCSGTPNHQCVACGAQIHQREWP